MHMAFIIQDMYRLGAQYVTSLLAKGLSQRGHQVDLIVSAVQKRMAYDRPDLQPFSVPESVRVVNLPHERASKNVWALRQYLRQNAPDVALPMSSTYQLPTLLAHRLSGVSTRVIPVEHNGGVGMDLNISRIGKREGWVQRAVTGSMEFVLRADLSGMIAVSQGVKQALAATRRINVMKIHVIYNPVVDDGFDCKRHQKSRHPWLIEKTAPVIVAAGAHVPLKGYDLLVRAFKEVLRQIDCRLILFGEGTQTEDLKQLARDIGIADAVSFPGHTQNLPAELNNADAFVVSSHCESFSVVLVEALACGVPVVATDCPSGPREILRDGKFGILVEPNNLEALSTGILEVLKGNGIRPTSESWEPYILDRVVEQYEAVLAESPVSKGRGQSC